MAKRKNSPSVPAAASAADASTEMAATDTVAAASEETSDDAVLAALAAADQSDSPFSEPVDTNAIEVVTEATEEIEVELEAEDEDAVLAALAADDDTQTPATTTKSKKASTPKAVPVPTRQFCDVADHMDDAQLKTALDGINAKKVAEKATNVVQAITSGKKLSGFTKVGVQTLLAKGRITSKDLIEAFQADGKSVGTARAQGQQMTALFKALGIANPDPANPRELVAADNGLVKELAVLAA